jgi:hypothetical protein
LAGLAQTSVFDESDMSSNQAAHAATEGLNEEDDDQESNAAAHSATEGLNTLA